MRVGKRQGRYSNQHLFSMETVRELLVRQCRRTDRQVEVETCAVVLTFSADAAD